HVHGTGVCRCLTSRPVQHRSGRSAGCGWLRGRRDRNAAPCGASAGRCTAASRYGSHGWRRSSGRGTGLPARALWRERSDSHDHAQLRGACAPELATASHLAMPETLHTPEIAAGALPRLSALIPAFHGSAANFSILVVALATVAVGWWLFRTRSGYELRATGLQPEAAEYGGVNVGRSWTT